MTWDSRGAVLKDVNGDSVDDYPGLGEILPICGVPDRFSAFQLHENFLDFPDLWSRDQESLTGPEKRLPARLVMKGR